MINKDYYKILGVSKTASQEDIRNAYLKLAKFYHPDINPNNKKSEENMKLINEAYFVLSDPKKRSDYDLFGYYERPQETNSKATSDDFINSFSDIIKELREKLHSIGLDSVFQEIAKILEDDSNPEKAKVIKQILVGFASASLATIVAKLIQSLLGENK